MGAEIIEKHVTIDKRFNGPDKDVSISFKEFGNMIKQIRNIEKSLGSKKLFIKRERN